MAEQEKRGGGGRNHVASSLEMEPMTIESSQVQTSSQSSLATRIRSLFMLCKLYMEYYPGITSCIAALLVGMGVLAFVLSFHKPVTRNRLYHDYSHIDMTYNFKAAQVDHWCLWGGDDQCACDDFTTPLSREEKKGWIQTHAGNVHQIDDTKDYDVIFYGDEVVEGWNGNWLGKPMVPPAQGMAVKDYFAKTFTKVGGGEFEGLALGTLGDVVSGRVQSCIRHADPYCCTVWYGMAILHMIFLPGIFSHQYTLLESHPTCCGDCDMEKCPRLWNPKFSG